MDTGIDLNISFFNIYLHIFDTLQALEIKSLHWFAFDFNVVVFDNRANLRA